MIEEEKIPEEELPDTGSPLPETGNLQPETQQPETSNLITPTSDMEVHHHGHVHEQKKWKEYGKEIHTRSCSKSAKRYGANSTCDNCKSAKTRCFRQPFVIGRRQPEPS
jgi:hypothetical protein